MRISIIDIGISGEVVQGRGKRGVFFERRLGS